MTAILAPNSFASAPSTNPMNDTGKAHKYVIDRWSVTVFPAMPNVRAKLPAEACVACPRKDNDNPGLERASNACRSGSA